MNDNARRATEWERLVGEFLSPLLGGEPSAWGEANRVVFERQWARFEAWSAARGEDGYGDFFAQHSERVRWLRETCELAGIELPDEDASYRLACETEAYVMPRVRADFPDAAEAIRSLRAAGHRLGTASGHPSSDLEGVLAIMDVREHFSDRLYGPDLVRVLKNGPEYYRRIFADAGVEARDALVVDDSRFAIAWAAQAGAMTVHVLRQQPTPSADANLVVGDLLELVEALEA